MNPATHSQDSDAAPHLPATATTHVRYEVLAWLCAAATIAYICRNSIAVAESTIRRDLELSEQQMGLAISVFFLSYALGQIPCGLGGERWGSRRSLPIFSVAWSVATGVMAAAFGTLTLVLARIANGIAQAGLFPCSTQSIARWFPDDRRAIANGGLTSFMSVGGAVGSALTGLLVVWLSWRWMFGLYAILGVAWAAGFYSRFRDDPSKHPRVGPRELGLIRGPADPITKPLTGPTESWRALAGSRSTWWICGQQFCRAAGQVFFASWFATYMQETRNVSIETSGVMNALPLVTLVFGGLVGGFLSDAVLSSTGNRWLARSGVAAASMFACAGLVFAAFFIANAWLAVLAISVGTFFAAVGGPCAYTVTIDMGGSRVASLFATMNMVGNLGAFAFINAVPVVTRYTNRWDLVLILFGVVYAGAGFIWLLIDPRRTVFQAAASQGAAHHGAR